MDEWQAAHADLKPRSPEPPRWLLGGLNQRLPDAVEVYREHRWRGNAKQKKILRYEVLDFLLNSEYARLFDHWGTDSGGNFISEPYYGILSDLEPGVRELAAQLGLRYTVSPVAFHSEACARITIYKPEVQKDESQRAVFRNVRA
jgi:hypothetical protein